MVNDKKHRIRIPLYAKILLGMGLGIGFGFLAIALHGEGFVREWVAPFGTIFMRLLKLIAVPLVLLSLILGIDRPLDMVRTMVNVTGDMTVACVVDKRNKTKSAGHGV